MKTQAEYMPRPPAIRPRPYHRLTLVFKPAEYARLRAVSARERRTAREQAEKLLLDALAELDTAPEPEPAQVPA